MRFVSRELQSGRIGSRVPPPEPSRQAEPLRRPTTTPLDPPSPRRRGWVGVQPKLNTFGKRVRRERTGLSGRPKRVRSRSQQGWVLDSTLFGRGNTESRPASRDGWPRGRTGSRISRSRARETTVIDPFAEIEGVGGAGRSRLASQVRARIVRAAGRRRSSPRSSPVAQPSPALGRGGLPVAKGSGSPSRPHPRKQRRRQKSASGREVALPGPGARPRKRAPVFTGVVFGRCPRPNRLSLSCGGSRTAEEIRCRLNRRRWLRARRACRLPRR